MDPRPVEGTTLSPADLPTANVTTAADDPDAYLYALGSQIYVILGAIIVASGCVGNALALALTLRRRLRQAVTVTVFIAALAITDTLVLVLDFINNWFNVQLKIDLFKNLTFCVFHRWFFNVCYTSSAWYIAAVAVERFIVVFCPLQARVWCTFKKALFTVIAIPILLGLIYVYNFLAWEISDTHGSCDTHPDYEALILGVSPWLTAVLYSYLPLVVLLTCNSAIVYKLARATRKRQHMTGENSADAVNIKVTIMMVTVCTAYIVTTVPLSIWYIYVFSTGRFVQQTAKETFTEICILVVALMNHSINFFLYVLTSSNFRSELVIMLRCAKVTSPSSESLNTEQSVLTVSRG